MNRASRWLCLCLLLPACALARRDHRPVWNAVEQHVVPTTQPAFALALPLTVPLGLLAIVTDSLVVHPLRAAGAAADDAMDLWRHLDWEQQYFTEAGFTPFRAAATPCWFALAWLGRCVFDGEADSGREVPVALDAEALEAARQAEALAWLQQLAQGGLLEFGGEWPQQSGPELQAAIGSVQASAPVRGRLLLYRNASHHALLAAQVDWLRALQDASAVVRYEVLARLPAQVEVPAELWQQLRQDPDEAVRARAAF